LKAFGVEDLGFEDFGLWLELVRWGWMDFSLLSFSFCLVTSLGAWMVGSHRCSSKFKVQSSKFKVQPVTHHALRITHHGLSLDFSLWLDWFVGGWGGGSHGSSSKFKVQSLKLKVQSLIGESSSTHPPGPLLFGEKKGEFRQ